MNTNQAKQSKFIQWCKRAAKWAAISVLAFVAVLIIGLIPVNNDFRPTKNGIKIYVVSNAVHADIIVPKKTDVIDWSERFKNSTFAGDISGETHIAFGWGDRGFFLETETWDDLKLSVAANALLIPSGSCAHVCFTQPTYYSDAASVTISESQYQLLVDFINETFEVNEAAQFQQIHGHAYSTCDAFFDAKGQYHLLNTCNSWVGRALKNAKVKVPWLSPMPNSPTLYFESGTGESN